MFVKHYAPEIHFGKLLLKQSEPILEHLTPVTLTFHQVTLSIGFLCHTWWMCGPCLRKEGQGILELLIVNCFGDHN